MRQWSKTSYDRLLTCDKRLQQIITRVLHEVADISIISGHRGPTEQNDLFERGLSTLRFPDSKHNKIPSIAIDIQPYPYPEHEPKLWGALGYIAGRAIEIALEEGIVLRWGGDWDRDGDLTNQSFDDLFHLEIVE